MCLYEGDKEDDYGSRALGRGVTVHRESGLGWEQGCLL
jgi:hypothetical protein